MIRTEPYPLTPQMMWIASHPSNPWLAPECYQFPTNPLPEKNSSGNRSVFIPQTFDTQDAFIKHIASKVRVEDK
jgi:hypothetical protein